MKWQRRDGWLLATRANVSTYGFRLHWHGKLWSKTASTRPDKAGWRCLIGGLDCLLFLQFMACIRTEKRATVDEVRRTKREFARRTNKAR